MSSASPTSPGEDSIPDCSEKSSGSKGFRGVVKEGLRNCGAGAEDAEAKEFCEGCEPNPPGAVSLVVSFEGG